MQRWNDEPITRDIRGIRRLATHHAYQKRAEREGPVVQNAPQTTGYTGPRDLLSYCKAGVDHLKALDPLIAVVDADLSQRHGVPR